MEECLDPLLEVSGNALRPGLVFTETTSIISNLYFFVTCIQEPNLVDKNFYFAEIPSLVHSSARDSFLRQWRRAREHMLDLLLILTERAQGIFLSEQGQKAGKASHSASRSFHTRFTHALVSHARVTHATRAVREF